MSFLEISLAICLTLLTISMVISLIRIIIGPSLPDRIISLEIMTFMIIGIVGVYSIQTGNKAFLDVAVIISLISFVATIAFAYYLERRIDR
ncbi:MAG: monovalent cation/H+ antiporter complex subunit F [Thermodesulfobacteriota bacterium]